MPFKRISLLLFLGIDLIGCAPKNSDLETCVRLLENPPEFQWNDNGFSALNRNAVQQALKGTSGPKEGNMHLVDVNDDGLNDIIYQNVSHYSETRVLLNKDTHFEEIWRYPGRLVKVKKGAGTKIYIIKHALGCDSFTELIRLTVTKKDGISEYIVSHHFDTKIKNLGSITEHESISAVMRSTPILDDESKTDPCTGDVVFGNRLRTLADRQVTLLKQEGDWWLVCHGEKNQGTIGWIEKKEKTGFR